LVYSVTKVCGPEFYSCARGINAFFVVASGIVIYGLAKYISGKKWMATIVLLGAVFGSFGTYTAYFMPEAIFNFFMVLFFFGLVRFGNSDRILVWAALGTVLGIASLAKPHALFVIPALLIYIFLATRATKTTYLLQALKRLGVFLAAVLMSKLGIGYLLAGPKALSLFGSYGGVTIDSNFVSSSADLVGSTLLAESTLANVLVTSWGQTLMMIMILGVSMAVAITSLLSSWTKNSEYFLANRFRTLFAISLLNMMAVAALFEAWLSLTNWMHTRYSSYLIPLALVVLVESIVRTEVGNKKLTKRIVVGIFTVLSAIALVTAAMPYGANWIDAPDFKAHIDNAILSSFAIVVAIALGIWWLWKEKTPMLVGLIFALVASLGAGTHISTFLQASFGQDITYDDLGRVLRNYLPQDELDRTVLVGDNNTAMERALFGSLSGEAKAILAPQEGFDIGDVPLGTRWLIKVGEPIVLGAGQPDITGNGYAFYSLSPENKKLPRFSDAVGFSGQCEDGSLDLWSCSGATDVTLGANVGPNATIDLIVELSEEAAAAEVEFGLGDATLAGTLPVGLSALTIDFGNTMSAKTLTIRSKNQNIIEGKAKIFKIVSLVSIPRN
jgi:phosphoglycerol transferase